MSEQPQSQNPQPPQSLTLQQLLAHTLAELGIETQEQSERLLLDDGLQLAPHMVDMAAQSNGSWRTSTVIEVYHPLIEDVLFEYQHSAGASQLAALHEGFNTWARMDLVTLRDAVQPELERPSLGLGYADEATGEAYQRQVVLGPTGHYQQQPPEEKKACPIHAGSEDESAEEETETEAEESEHDFCPCCLFTNSMQAFADLLKSREFLGVRLYAARDAQGEVSADCRVNGHDFPAALPYLQAYAQSWPQAGLEFRKQYVIIRNQP